jgi:hypothetical protein
MRVTVKEGQCEEKRRGWAPTFSKWIEGRWGSASIVPSPTTSLPGPLPWTCRNQMSHTDYRFYREIS